VKTNKKGETLIEVIAALTSLVLAGIAAMTLIISVMTSTAISKEYLIAQNLAREGIEGVTNIRDTNWLLYPSEKATKWLTVDTGGFYKLEKGDKKEFILTKGPLPITDDTYKIESVQSPPTFYRQITFSTVPPDLDLKERVKIAVTVAWMNKSNLTKYELSSILVNYEK